MLHASRLIFATEFFIGLSVSLAKKSPFVPLCQRGNSACDEHFPSLKKRGQGRFWTRVSYSIALTIFLSNAAGFAAQEKLANVTIAYTSISPQYAPVWIAKEAGFFKKNGINAQLVYMRGGVVATQALVSNDVNFINAGGGGVVDAVLGGADIFIVASPINQEPQVLVTKREIKDLAQLKGKKLAVNSLIGPAMLSLKMILAASGLDPERDVSYLAVGPSSSRFGALQLNQVDATTLAPPFTFAARRAGYNFFEDLPGMRDSELPNAALTTSRKFYDAEPFATEMVIKSVIEGIHFYKTENIKTPMIMKKYMKLENTEELQEAYSFYVKLLAEKPYPSAKGIQTILDWSKRLDARKANPAQFIQTKVIEKLDKQGFIDGLYTR
ncbi:MAG: ABC transporter substrate-binding protein [Deltaproteobacteria bacterium]|nr:MAG: ABC transporter substrate-binding protein [Deltaproteobacteria bacterium]